MSELKSTTSGMIAFGMVNVPVRFYPAISEKGVSFKNRHKGCSNPVQAPRKCPDCEAVGLGADELEKCYSVGKQLVVLTDDELANLPHIDTSAITIEEMVLDDETPYTAVEKSYYLGPDDRQKVGHKAFVLLREALRQSGKTAMCKLARSNKEQEARITVVGDVLQIDYLYWSDECNDWRDVPVPAIEVSEQALAMAKMLVDALPESEGEPRVDGFKAAVEEVVNAKLSGNVVEMPVRAAAPAQTEDLLAMLQASVASMAPAAKGRAKKEKVA